MAGLTVTMEGRGHFMSQNRKKKGGKSDFYSERLVSLRKGRLKRRLEKEGRVDSRGGDTQPIGKN